MAVSGAGAQEFALPIVNYGSAGWTYAIVGTYALPGFEDPDFDDSGWSIGTAPWGIIGNCVAYRTAWPINTDLLVRRVVDVPPNGRLMIAAKIDNDIIAYVDGSAVGPMAIFDGCGGAERFSVISPPLAGGPVVVAIRARDRGGESHFDTRIELAFTADCNADGTVDYVQIRGGRLADLDADNIPDCCEAGTACTVDDHPVQWRVTDGGNGHWYRAERTFRIWPEAKVHAEMLGGHLATVLSGAELDFVRPLLANEAGADLWLGASRPDNESPWSWVTGEPFDFVRWDVGQPDNGPESLCLEIVGRPELGGFGTCNDELLYAWGGGNHSMIEWSADCDADGVIDYGQILRGEVPDVNGNGIPDTCECPADIDRDGTVAAEDLAAILFAWGMTGAKTGSGDVDRSGMVDGLDLAAVLAAWGPCGD